MFEELVSHLDINFALTSPKGRPNFVDDLSLNITKFLVKHGAISLLDVFHGNENLMSTHYPFVLLV